LKNEGISVHKKIFFSYTLSDSEIDVEILLKLKQKFKDFTEIETYFDILDNHSLNHQEYVYKMLAESDALCLIKTSEINKSVWVSKELLIAKEREIPIIEIWKKELLQILSISSKDIFLKCIKVKEIIHTVQGCG